jgi:iron-sulfur cluster assembly accessory protein
MRRGASVVIEVTAAAAERIRASIDPPGALLRVVALADAGCAPQYLLALDDAARDGDVLVERDGVRLVLDADTALLAAGSRIDWVEDALQSGFFISSPGGADGGCGPGCSCA